MTKAKESKLIEQTDASNILNKLIDKQFLTPSLIEKHNPQVAKAIILIQKEYKKQGITCELLIEKESFYGFLAYLIKKKYLSIEQIAEVNKELAQEIAIDFLASSSDGTLQFYTTCKECGSQFNSRYPERGCPKCRYNRHKKL